MLKHFSEYMINECFYEGAGTSVYRVRHKADFRTFTIKTTCSEYPSLEEITRLRHEYKVLKTLADVPGVIRVYRLENHDNDFALILEDVPGLPLAQVLQADKLPVSLFLHIALQLTTILQAIHQRQVIHKDINPQNILLDVETWAVTLIDFSIASRLSKETPCFSYPDALEGTLAYISPEQTGRMNRVVDYRTDFYALGVTFYQMLTGQLPFPTTDPLELVHCHIAKPPTPPHELCSDIPIALSQIILKLMAKTAEERYQTATGLKHDLELCQQQLQADRSLNPDFLQHWCPGQLDRSGQLLIPQKLYGRDNEVLTLLDAFRRSSRGLAELVLIAGYSGIGKTSVVQEVYKPITEERGYFVAGKFDQLKRNIPYAALIQAFQILIQQLLTQPDEQIEQWKRELLIALGQNAQVIIDVIPEVEHLVGTQPAVPILGPTEAQHRFNQVFQRLIRVFAKPEHPLVVFLDDLQWADAASLQLMQAMLTNDHATSLLLIGAYRDNEVDANHITAIAMRHWLKAGVRMQQIELHPLSQYYVSELICDTLHEELTFGELSPHYRGTEIKAFIHLLYHKTQGNPFFLNHLLQSLYLEQLLKFDFAERRWLWDLEQIQRLGITDLGVVELIASNLQKLPLATQSVLQLAACIGYQFDLETLAVVNQTSLLDTANQLWDALQAGLVLPVSPSYKVPLLSSDVEQHKWRSLQAQNHLKVGYKFLHDRIQQAAYSLIPADQKQATHLKIGQLLLRKTPQSLLEDYVFEIVNQFNVAIALLTDTAEREQLASLNLLAGRKAKASTAYEAAVQYFETGLQLLPDGSWQTHYELLLNLHTEAVEAYYLNTQYAQATQLAEVVLAQAKTALEKVNIYEPIIQTHIAQNHMPEAISTALVALKLLGISLSERPAQLEIVAGAFRTKWAIGLKRIEDLATLPTMTDPDKLAAMRILITLIVPAFLSSPTLFPVVTFKMVSLCVKHGNSAQAAYGYALYGWLLCSALNDIPSGYQFGQLALKLMERFDDKALHCKVINIVNAFIRPWKEPAHQIIPTFEAALQVSLETGNIEYAGYSSINYCHYGFLVGEELEQLSAAQQPYLDLMHKLKQEYALHSVSTVGQTVLNLLGKSADPCQLVGDRFNESALLPVIKEANVMTSLFMIYFYKSMLQYLFQQYDAAVESASLAKQYEVSILGFLTLPVHYFYYSLALLAQVRQPNLVDNTPARKHALKQVEANQKHLKEWAIHAPANFEHKYLLVEAEKARILGRDRQAMEYFDQAIKGARQNGYIQEEALANELAAEFYFACNQKSTAEVYLLQAYYRYIRWGAQAKASNLETRYAEFFAKVLHREERGLDITHLSTLTQTISSLTILDATATAKALEAISSETNYDRLLSRLFTVTVQVVGASKGFLLVARGQTLELLAEGSAEAGVRMIEQADQLGHIRLPLALIRYVQRTHQAIVLSYPANEGIFTADPYIQQMQPKCLFCYPLIHQQKFAGVLYLENYLAAETFTHARLEILEFLAAQVAISIVSGS